MVVNRFIKYKEKINMPNNNDPGARYYQDVCSDLFLKHVEEKESKTEIEEKVRYDCKDNDNHIYFNFVDGKIDELQIGDCLEKSWTVISLKDLKEAFNSFGYTFHFSNEKS